MKKKQKQWTAAIKQTINREESKRMWYLIKRTVKDPHSPSVLKVQRVINGDMQEYEVQEDVKNVIQHACEIRFFLAHSAPIMTTLLGKQLRYLLDKTLARAIITKLYDIPSDMDPATKLILEEIDNLSVKLINEENTEIEITPEDFKRFWKRVGEFTSSLMSGVHYGHYKAAIQCNISTKILAQQLTVVAQSGIPPKSWSVGLQVMLEKIVGIYLVEKLQAIQLYEADFNCYNQFVFGKTAMESLNSVGYAPKELFSQKGSTSKDAKFDKTPMSDLSRQARHPMTVVLADAAYCYNRVNHIIMMLVWLVLTNNNIPAIVASLICLQTMKFFQRTGFGESKTFLGGINYLLCMMGLGQGNRAAPPSWIQLSAVMVTVFKQLNLGAIINDPILDELIHSMGILFVNDMDMYTWRKHILNPGELWAQMQTEIKQWSCLLDATGGALKPEKCWWYILDYTCIEGKWKYADIVPRELFITNPDGTKSMIKQEEVTVSKKTLGIYDAPVGGNNKHLNYIKGKAMTWVNRMSNRHLPCHMAWAAYKHQLWPGLRYGLGTMTNDISPAAKLLDDVDYKTLNVLGILRNITKGLQRIHTTFSGFGLFDLPTEQLISRVSMFFQHYHVSTNLSKKLDVLLGYLQLQIETPSNPFLQDYNKWGNLAPLSWVKMLWKSLHHFEITLQMKFPTIAPPQESNKVIMDIVFEHHLNTIKVARLNRCRVSLQAIFLSDITTADGKYLEDFVFNPGGKTRQSRYSFPREKPSRQDWDQWVNFWHKYTTTGGKLKSHLGGWINPTHRIWQWYYNKNREVLYHVEGTMSKVFSRATGWRHTRSTTTFKLKQTSSTATKHFKAEPMSVVRISESKVNKLQEGTVLVTKAEALVPFWTFIASWEGNWMWRDIINSDKNKNDMQWVADRMTAGTLI
jgi:hypothetical protein